MSLRPLHLILSCFSLARGVRLLDDESIPPQPSIVIAGIGDSGATAVTVALRDVGMESCLARDQFNEPYWGHQGREKRIKAFLNVTHGEFTRDAYSRDFSAYLESQSWMIAVAKQDYGCILKQRSELGLPFRKGTGDIKWGFKEPHYTWLLPIMDEAFRNKTKYLLVARDPRDICSNDIQDQFRHYAPFLNVSNCYVWWATLWSRLLETYENEPRFAIVRIEDLVLPDPLLSKMSLETMGCVAEHVGMKVDFTNLQRAVVSLQRTDESGLESSTGEGAEARSGADRPQQVGWWKAEKVLRRFHEHTGSYLGHHDNFTEAKRQSLVSEVKGMTEPPLVHETMRRLGYDPMGFNMLKPTTRAVLCHPA